MPHPNRSKNRDTPGRNPAGDDMRAAREALGWSPAEAARPVFSTGQWWEDCEAGRKRCHPAVWQLWQLKTGEPATAEVLTALLICAASEIDEADHYELPAWALDQSGAPDFQAITVAGRALLKRLS
jgi:hypothetical protein